MQWNREFTTQNKSYFLSWKPLYKFLSCEYSFANLAMWGELYDIQWCDFDGTPLIHIKEDQYFLFPHIPKITPEQLHTISNIMIKEGFSGKFTQVPEEYILKYPELTNYYTISQNSDFSDYIHSTERLSLLKGRKLRKKRNLISQFIKKNPEYKVIQLNKKHFDDCLELTKNGIEKTVTGKDEEIQAIQKAFSLYTELDLNGIAVYTGDRLAAFSIFSRNIDNCYVIHFEKNDRKQKGSAQIINLKTAEFLSDKCEFINREQDLGVPGLKKAKLSYDPDRILLNYELTPK